MPSSWNLMDSESFRELIARQLRGLILPRNHAHIDLLSIKVISGTSMIRGARAFAALPGEAGTD
jgi:hypothetical protein